MKQVQFGTSGIEVPNIVFGCMRMAALSDEEAQNVLHAALEEGYTYFDHADIYGKGESERIFGRAVKALGVKREDIFIQSKCGIRDGFFDFSREHILNSVDGILERLDMDYIDVLLLHRPDTLFDPKEVAETILELKAAGKIKHFGVSNQNPGQIKLLQKYLGDEPICMNQLQFSIMRTGMIDAGFNVNMKNEAGVNRDDSILEFSRLEDITIQAWSPFQYGYFEGVFLDNEKFPELNEVIDRIAIKHQVTNNTIAVSWILTHPANMQVAIGTMNIQRIKECAQASHLILSREEWYEIYRAAGNVLP